MDISSRSANPPACCTANAPQSVRGISQAELLSMRILARLFLAVALAAVTVGAQPALRKRLVIVGDGLRRDYVTAEAVPRLFRLGQRGTVFAAHHAVFPTVTRVNASSFVTGVYPEAHGLLGNTIYIPSVE